MSSDICGWVCTWGEFLARSDSDAAEQFRRHESTGRPLGDKGFLERIGAILARDLVPKKPGRKPKAEK